MTVFDLSCNEIYSSNRAAVEGSGRFAAFVTSSWPGKVEGDVE